MPSPPVHLLPNVIDHDYANIDLATWRQIRSCGIQSLELGATSEPFPKALIGNLTALGFSFLGHGSSLWNLQNNLAVFISEAHDRKEPFILCYWPWLDAADHITRRQVSDTCTILQDIGRRCRQENLRFAFHNHGLEFASLDGMTICDHMLRETDPALVSLELDVYHMVNAGHDPLPFMARHHDRIGILHLNAMDGHGDEATVGDGIPGFAAMLTLIPSVHLVIEGHAQKDPLRYVRSSHARLLALLAIPPVEEPSRRRTLPQS